jgi:outer membrane protein OmpA-like peptidoglycan-associated protein
MRLQPGARAAGSIGEWSWAAQGWATFRPTNETMRGATIGSEVGVGASFGRRFLDEKWLAGIEANAARVLISGSDGPTTATVEAMAELRATVADGLTIHGGAGLGILRGAGTPDWRTVLTIDWHPDPTPTTPTPKLDAARTGCAGDAERAHAITQSESDEGASVASVTRERRTPSAPVAAIEEDRIVVTSAATPGSTGDAIDDVLFDNDRSVLLPASTATIAAVARVIAEHPEIKLVRVDGHADSRADEAHNEALSEARAAAVIDGLIRAGVDRRRLTSAAHGSREPITTNATEAGRARNRRVTFTLVETRP